MIEVELDEARLAGLTGPQLRPLYQAFLDAFPSQDDLRRVLLFGPDKRLDQYAPSSADMKVIVFEVLTQARDEGWLPGLVVEAVNQRPGHRRLREFAQQYRRSPHAVGASGVAEAAEAAGAAGRPGDDSRRSAESAAAVPENYRLFNSTFFDLAEVQEIVLAKVAVEPSTVLAFATTYAEETYLEKLQERIEYLVGKVQRKKNINLREDIRSPEAWADELITYRDESADISLSFRVHVDGVDPTRSAGGRVPTVIQTFWERVCSDFAAVRGRLVLLFVSRVDLALPVDIIPLAAPAFTRTHVLGWTHDVVWHLGETYGWPLELRQAWLNLLCDKATVKAATGGRGMGAAEPVETLDARALYLAIDETTAALSKDPAAFRLKLEEVGNADPSSC